MEAFILKEIGGIENLKKVDIEIPQIENKQVLIKTKAIGVNRIDNAVRQYKEMLDLITNGNYPDKIILGWDVSGEIVEIGKEVNNFKVGDKVFGLINMPGLGATNAEYVVADSSHITLMPKNFNYAESAATPMAALTAWLAVVEMGKTSNNHKVLIQGAAGGVGHFAVQIAKSFGAYVIGTGSPENKKFILSLGADEFIDYKIKPFEEQISSVDIVIDTVPSIEHIKRSINVLKKDGKIVFLQPHFYDDLIPSMNQANVTGHGVFVSSSGENLSKITKLIESGKIKTTVSKTFDFDDLPEAHQELEKNNTIGKIVITVN